jgi:hypothetical protein
MKAWRALYHLVRADFYERVRRYSFLITLGATILAGYYLVPAPDAGYSAGILPHDVNAPASYFRGVYNSAWIGSMVALITTLLLSLPGFYLVKGSLERDRCTGVGEILATTPLSKALYCLGKWLSNLAVLATMVGLLAVTALIMQLVRGEELQIDAWKLLSPFVFIVVPVMAVIAALAVLFEALRWLRGGFGNVVFFFLWVMLVITDLGANLSGWRLLVSDVEATAQAAFPECAIFSSIGINEVKGSLQTFHWPGIGWTWAIVLGRLLWAGAGLAIALVAAALIGRFDAVDGLPARARLSIERGRRPARRRPGEPRREAPPPAATPATEVPAPLSAIALTPAPARFQSGRVLLAELRLMLKGRRWWWFAVALALIVAGLWAPVDVSQSYLLPLAWFWPLLIWSGMGTREARHRTGELVFSAAHPLRRQLPAIWLAGVAVALVTGGGVGVHLVLAGDWASVQQWVVGALFIPTLALAMGIWSGSSKLYEVVYTILWYVGPISGVRALDFTGATCASGVGGRPLTFLLSTAGLLGLAVAGRRRQLAG